MGSIYIDLLQILHVLTHLIFLTMLGGTHLYNYGIIVLLRVEEAKIE